MPHTHVAQPSEPAAAPAQAATDDLADLELLHRISTTLIGEQDLGALYE